MIPTNEAQPSGMFADSRIGEYENQDNTPPGPAYRQRPQIGRKAIDNLFARGFYSCPELGRTCDRPNAYDAFDLPSLYDGQRKPYRFADDGSR